MCHALTRAAELTGDKRQASDLQELTQLVRDIAARVQAQDQSRELSASATTQSETDELCPICYSATVDTTFAPCQHRSCYRCISMHLLNKKQCFFCNALLESIQRTGEAPLKIAHDA
jgi:hypothetical protein